MVQFAQPIRVLWSLDIGLLIKKLYNQPIRLITEKGWKACFVSTVYSDFTERRRTTMENQLDRRIEQALPAWEQKTQIDIVRLQTTLEQVSKSRFGGALGEAPSGEDGEPLQLLCAIFCSEIKGVPNFPKKGVLRFYIGKEPLFGLDYDHPTKQKNWRVLYDPEEPDDMPKTAQTLQTQHPIKGCFCLKFSSEKESLAPPDYRFRPEFERFLQHFGRTEPIDWEEYDALMNRYSLRGNKLGGYAWNTQDDPRCREGLGKYDTLLLQIDSVYRGDCRISFGDAGVALFLIPSDKLKALDFSDVLFWWDCY